MRFESRTVSRLKTSVVIFCAATFACGFYLQHTQAAPDKKGKSAQLERGRTVFMQNCARCHGADGRAQTDLGQLYDAKDLTDAGWWRAEHITDRRLINSVTNGKKGGMPAYGKKLSRDDITAVVAFIKTLKK